MVAHSRSRLTRAALAIGFASVLPWLLPGVAHAHGELKRSNPASGEHLSTVPRELRLTFNERVELAVARVTLTGPVGPVQLGRLALHPDSAEVLLVPVASGLVAGSYQVSWQVSGPDGHPVRGEFSFVIAQGAAGLAPQPAPGQPAPPVIHHQAALPEATVFNAGSAPYAVVRWLTFIALLGVIGAVAFRLVLLLAARQRIPACAAVIDPAARRAAGLGLWMAALLLLASALRLIAQSYALHGAQGAFQPTLLSTMAFRTLWGWGWLLQVSAAIVALEAFRRARRASNAGWYLAAAAAVALAFTPALSGHAAASRGLGPLPVMADALHVLGAGGWLGSLLGVLAAGVPAALRLPESDRGTAIATLVNAFSPTALFFAGLTVATGLVASWIHIGSIAALWQSAYGRTLLLKLAVLAGVFGTGAYNWLRVRPALGDQAASGRLRQSAVFELAIGMVVLAVTAVLVATATPEFPRERHTAANGIERSASSGSTVR